jgi:hypothetical protein
MRRNLALLCLAGLALSGCVSSPKETVLNLDTTDPRWTSKACVAARKEAARYNDHSVSRGVVGAVGNFAAPFAGTATSLAWRAAEAPSRKALNRRVRSACISDPLHGKGARPDLRARVARR